MQKENNAHPLALSRSIALYVLVLDFKKDTIFGLIHWRFDPQRCGLGKMKNIAIFRQHYYALTYKCFHDSTFSHSSLSLSLHFCIVLHIFLFGFFVPPFRSFSIQISLYRLLNLKWNRMHTNIHWKLINQMVFHLLTQSKDMPLSWLREAIQIWGHIGTWTVSIFLMLLVLHLFSIFVLRFHCKYRLTHKHARAHKRWKWNGMRMIRPLVC